MDKKEIYETEIAPLMKGIKDICANNQMPFFACFFTDNKDDSEKVIEYLSPNLMDAETPQNLFCKFINVVNGFNTIPYHEPVEIEIGDMQIPDFME